MCAAAEKYAVNRRDIGIVSPPSQSNVVRPSQAVVRRIEIDPTRARKINRHPGMRGIGANQLRLIWWRLGDQVAAHIARRQTKRSQTGNLQLGKILAYAAATPENFRQRRANTGGRRIVLAVSMNTMREVEHGIVQRSASWKRLRRIQVNSVPARIRIRPAHINGRIVFFAKFPLIETLDDLLPRHIALWRRR